MAVFANLASAAHTTGGTAQFNVESANALNVGCNITAVSGTSPKLNLYLEYYGPDGNWYIVWTKKTLATAGSTLASVGLGAATAGLVCGTMRLRWSVSGTSPSFTFTAFVAGTQV